MKRFTIKLFLFDYQGTQITKPVLRCFWDSNVPTRQFDESFTACRDYALRAIAAGDCRDYHIVAGESS